MFNNPYVNYSVEQLEQEFIPINSAHYNNTVQIKYFDNPVHMYFASVNDFPFTHIPNSTTILNLYNDKPYLNYWNAKAASDYIYREASLELQNSTLTPEKLKIICNVAKKEPKRLATEAASIGTAWHDYLEQYVKAHISLTHSLPPHPTTFPQVKWFKDLVKWQSRYNVQFQASEFFVVSLKHFFAGTLDLKCIYDGKKAIVDFKTNNYLSPSYIMQLASYTFAYIEEHGDIPEIAIILRFDKENQVISQRVIPFYVLELAFEDFKGFASTNTRSLVYKNLLEIPEQIII